MSTSDFEIKYLASLTDDEEEAPPPEFPECAEPPPETEEGWFPELNEPQTELFNNYTQYLLLDSERFSGKSYGVGHKIVRHAWENWDALVLVTSYTLSGLQEGLMEDLEKDILPDWEKNIGLKWVGPKANISKTSFIKVANRFGGWSTIIFKPCPSVSIIDERFKPIKASMIVFEEMGDKNDSRYFEKLTQQLRRKGIKDMQFIAVTNPPKEGPEHYLYDRFFVEPEDEEAKAYWKRKYHRIHFPAMKNRWRDVKEYMADLKDKYRHDPNSVDRLVKGIWVKQILGEGIFKDYFLPAIHIKGDLQLGRQLVAQPGLPIILGADMGDVNNGFTFQQMVHVKDRVIWMQVGELESVGRKIPLNQMIHLVYHKMNAIVRQAADAKRLNDSEMLRAFRFEHISDSSTLRFRQSGGDVERQLILEASNEILRTHGSQYPCVNQPIWMKPAPKGDGSVAFRVKMLIEMLQTERFIMDATCTRTTDMFTSLNSSKKKDGSPFEPPAASPYKHILDALTYPHVHFQVHGRPKAVGDRVKPMVY